MKALAVDLWKRFRDESSHWQFMNSLFKPSLTRFFISWFALAPAVVWITGRLDAITLFGKTVPLSLPFNWEILWWASFIYAAAYVVYLFLCPRFVQRYPNFTAYEIAGHSPRWLVWEVSYASKSLSTKANNKLMQRIVEKRFAVNNDDNSLPEPNPVVTEKGTVWYFKYRETHMKLLVDETMSADRQRDLFWEILSVYARSRALLRYFIWLCLSVSAILVGLTVFENIRFVLVNLAST